MARSSHSYRVPPDIALCQGAWSTRPCRDRAARRAALCAGRIGSCGLWDFFPGTQAPQGVFPWPPSHASSSFSSSLLHLVSVFKDFLLPPWMRPALACCTWHLFYLQITIPSSSHAFTPPASLHLDPAGLSLTLHPWSIGLLCLEYPPPGCHTTTKLHLSFIWHCSLLPARCGASVCLATCSLVSFCELFNLGLGSFGGRNLQLHT